MQLIIFLRNGHTPHKTLAPATNTMMFLFKIPKHKITWSKSSILVAAAVLDLQPFKFAEGERKTSPSNASKSARLIEDINCQKG